MWNPDTRQFVPIGTQNSQEHSHHSNSKCSNQTNILQAFLWYLVFNLGGENLKEVVPTIQKLGRSNVGSILDLAIEADLDAVDLGKFFDNLSGMMI